MYLTAQRVLNPKTHATGVNVFRYEQVKEIIADPRAYDKIYHSVAEGSPGRLVDQIIGLKQGGNDVLSYLDVICHKDTKAETITEVLQQYRETMVSDERAPKLQCYREVIICFFARAGLDDALPLEFDNLAKGILAIVDHPIARPAT
jgi:hypothetical protein